MLNSLTTADWRNLLAWLRDGIFPPHLLVQGSGPTLAAGLHLGTGGSLALTSGSTDSAGNITFVTGSGSATGQLVSVTFAKAYPKAPFVLICPVVGPGATGGLGIEVANSATTGFDIYANSAPVDATQYQCTYFISAPK